MNLSTKKIGNKSTVNNNSFPTAEKKVSILEPKIPRMNPRPGATGYTDNTDSVIKMNPRPGVDKPVYTNADENNGYNDGTGPQIRRGIEFPSYGNSVVKTEKTAWLWFLAVVAVLFFALRKKRRSNV